MLFRTVYGPELGAIYRFIVDSQSFRSRRGIYRAFLPDLDGVSKQNVDDALAFLIAGGLIIEDKEGTYCALSQFESIPFRLLVLRRLREIATGHLEGQNEVDSLYWAIISEIFILPDHIYVNDLHSEANRMPRVKDVGGLSREKLQSWKRVMSYLGVGIRVARGFQCIYDPKLVLEILRTWHFGSGSLQEFLESHFLSFLPYQTKADGLSTAVQQSLLYLESTGQIALLARNDSPSKPYFGTRRIRHIALPEGSQ
jgi:hypothetical protein